MKNKISLIAISLLGLLTPFSFAENSVASGAPAVTTSQVTTVHRGTLFRVSHKGNTSYLFGTIHVGKPSFYPLGAEVDQALLKASKLVVELDMQNTGAIQVAMQKHGMVGVGDSIKNHLSPDHFAQLKQALAKANIPLESVMQMKPWLVANLLLELDLERSGYDRNQGIEEYLLKSAKQQNKQVLELESADFQFSLFSDLNERQQEQYLDEILIEIKDGKSRNETDELANAWMKADATELARLMRETLGEKTLSSEFMQRVLLDQRNPGMANKIEGFLKHDKVTFVGVGLLHLIGERSVPVLLRQRGYVVERVY